MITPLSARTHDLDPVWLEENLDVMRDLHARVIPPRFQDAVATVPEVINWTQKLIDSSAAKYKGTAQPPRVVAGARSLLLLGSVGVGKTHEAYGAFRALCESGMRVRMEFATAADLYADLRPRPGQQGEAQYERYSKADVLFLDDLGAAKGSEWNEEVNYRLINYRYEQMLTTFITSNLRPDQLSTLGERIASRLVDMADRVIMRGEDRRQRK